MSSTMQRAFRSQEVVGLGDVQRGEKGLTCCVCSGRLRVCDGKGERVKGKGSRNVPKGKYFAHVGNGGCYGEGKVHFVLKKLFEAVINDRRENPDGFMGMPYVCPSPEYAPHCLFKYAPGQDTMHREFPQMEHGHHHFDLLKNLHAVKCEHWLGGQATRADLVGLDREGNPLWVIEIKRTNISDKAVEYATTHGLPLFVVDVTNLPDTDDMAEDPVMLTGSLPFAILMENALRGFLPRAVETCNMKCDRQAFGMGPRDTHWRKDYVYTCRAEPNCGFNGCPDCEEVMLHECGGSNEDPILCPDVEYMFKNKIGPEEMYSDPTHLIHSHTFVE